MAMPQFHTRFPMPGNAEMELLFEANFEAFTEGRDRRFAALLWISVLICTAVVDCLAIILLYLVYLSVSTLCLLGLKLDRLFALLYTEDSAEAPDTNVLARDHSVVFRIITVAVVIFSLPVACIANEVLLFAYQSRNAWQGRHEPEVEVEVQAGEAFLAYLYVVFAYVFLKYVLMHEVPDVMEFSLRSTFVFWIIASRLPLDVALSAIDALFLAYHIWMAPRLEIEPVVFVYLTGSVYRYVVYMSVLGTSWQVRRAAAAAAEPEPEPEVVARRAEVVAGEAVEPEAEVMAEDVEFRVPERERESHSGTFEDIMVVLGQLSDRNSFRRGSEVFPEYIDL